MDDPSNTAPQSSYDPFDDEANWEEGVLQAEVTSSQEPWAVKLFRKSPLKQEKLKRIRSLLGDTTDLSCLDIGSDNGVISYFLRKQGGLWWSCDLEADTVESIRDLVGERVAQINGTSTPYENEQFHAVVIVDFLEHIHTDRDFMNELYRVLKPGGTLIVNVPNPKRGPLRWFRNKIGQGDSEHGHVRPGYSIADLKKLLGSSFSIETTQSYSRLFSVLVDTFITLGLDLLKGGKRGQKGRVVTGSDLGKMKKMFRLYTLIAPIVLCFVKLDALFPFLHGNMLIARCRKQHLAPEKPATKRVTVEFVE